MTEQEARKKWCPHALLTDGGMMYNRNALAPDVLQNGANCIASDCMMYRTTGEKKYLDRGKLYDKNLTDTGEWIDVGGYCGLANKP